MILRRLLLAAALCVVCATATATTQKLRVAGLFADHMVLQRDKPLPVWGWATPGAQVTVTARAQSVTATAGPKGKWSARLAPLAAGDPFTLTVRSGDETRTFDDVLAGEVWLCGGQSNMQWNVAGSANAQAEIAAADHPQIRVVRIPLANRPAPRADLPPMKWKVCSPENAGGFTAVGYYFGRMLHAELGVPVGLIDSNWGGTPIEAWTSATTLGSHPDFTKRVATIEAFAADPGAVAAGQQAIDTWNTARTAAFNDTDETWKDTGLDDTDWHALNLPGAWEQQGLPDVDGTVWYRRTFDVPANRAGQPGTLELGKVEDRATAYLNGTALAGNNPAHRSHRFDVPAGALKPGLNQIALRVQDRDRAGGVLGPARASRITLANGKPIPLAGEWKARPTDATAALTPPSESDFFAKNQPTGLYNAMIHPLTPYALRGVIWYQGESNAARAKQYRDLFPGLIHDWRARWDHELPFHWVQLANFRVPATEPGDSQWAELREAQSMTLALPNTGQAVTIDIGEANDIHPRNKQDVGARLARIALAKDYGQDIAYSGPVYRAMAVEGDRIRLTFEHAEGLTTSGGPLQRFEIAGADKVFVWANAKVEGDTVVAHNPAVKTPVAVRYAWADNPEGCNLTNAAGLPASPFRTDAD